MPLNPGTRFGPYEILSPLGAGGMGEVYRARDTRLDRTVAVKILSAHAIDQPDRKERFEREARAVSALSHPHICALHDVGTQDGVEYLVMEYLEGETLEARLAKGALPLAQALRFAIQIAGALDSAHRQGVVHRDLKPSNIMLTKSGAKLLDFGLAKLRHSQPELAGTALSAVPTRDRGLTSAGMIVGTLQYMSPEQLEGREADARSDIFSFGAVLYEMLAGRKAFEGASQASLIAAILERDPAPVTTLQPLTPKVLDRLVGRCLAKDRYDRWQTARDLTLELEWVAGGGSQAGLAAPAPSRPARRASLGWVVAGVVFLALIGTLLWGSFASTLRQVAAEPVRFSIAAPEGSSYLVDPESHNVALSPDGRVLAFVASTAGGGSSLWVRPLESLAGRALPGTEEATSPFWSPDSRYIAFFAEGKLKKVAAAGGPPQTVCPASGANTGSWGGEGTILFTQVFSTPEGIFQVPASGGTAAAAAGTRPTDKEKGHRWPHFLPDGRHFLFVAADDQEERHVYAGSLGSEETKMVAKLASRVEYSPPGYLVFVRDATLIAQSFDADTLALTGEEVPIAELLPNFITGWAPFSVSKTGVLAYQAGTRRSHLVWLDRTGKEVAAVGQPGDYVGLRLSPDGQKVALEARDAATGTSDLWILDLSRGTMTRFTRDPALESTPVWSPDGRVILFESHGGKTERESRQQALGTSESSASPIAKDTTLQWTRDWSMDGRFIAYDRLDPQTQYDLWLQPLFGDRKPFPLVHTQFNEGEAVFSPDGKWVAFSSDESGKPQVYVIAAGGSGEKWQVSTEGALHPRWRRDGKELFYVAMDRTLVSVPVRAGVVFEPGPPTRLFEIPTEGYNQYDVSPDGLRFLVNARTERNLPVNVVLNWTSGLKR